jgi:HEAT repeat protein
MSKKNWDQIIQDLHSQDGKLAIAAAEALNRASDETRIPDLLLLMDDDDFFIREAAAAPYASIEGVHALPQLFKALERGEQQGHDNDGLLAIISAVLDTNQKKAIPILLEMVRSSKINDKENAAWALGFLPPEDAIEPLYILRSDTKPEIRSAVAGSLGSFRSNPEVFDVLVEMLQDESEIVRVSAADALGYFGDIRAIPFLRKAQSDPSERVRKFSTNSLGQLGVKQRGKISDQIKQFLIRLLR